MIGDRLVITEYHRRGARRILDTLSGPLRSSDACVAVTVAGESGSGKSEIAQCLAELLGAEGHESFVLAQDDYFRLPPRSNHERRKKGLDWVGTDEVRLDLLDRHVALLKQRTGETFEKPLVDFAANRIGIETARPPAALSVVIAEGTYTTLLVHADLRVFIDRTYRQNRANRLKRARDPDPEFLESVLAIEHEIIAQHRTRADIVLPAPEEELGMAEPTDDAAQA